MRKYIIFLGLIALFFSCKNELEKPSWNTQLTAPLVHTQLNIQNILPDSTIQLDTLEDNSLMLVYQQELLSFQIDSLVSLTGITSTKNVKLDSIQFDNTLITHQITLGSIINAIPNGNLFFPDGSNSTILPFSNVLTDTLPIDANQYFEVMTLSEGFLDVTITNNLPTDLSNLEIILRNQNAQTNILQMSISLLPTGTSQTESVSLAGQTLDGDLEVEILNVDLVGTAGPVAINYTDALVAEILIRDIVPLEGIAIFPEQQVFEEDTVVAFDIDDAWLTGAIVAVGSIEAIGVSTIQDTLKVEYTIPSATKNGQMFELYLEIPPAPVGGSVTVTKNFDFSGYHLDLRGKNGDTINTIYTVSRGWIDSSGVLTNISLEDSVYNKITINQIIPEVAWGYLGQDTLQGAQEIALDLFDNFQGSFDLQQVSVGLLTENHLGASGQVQFTKLHGSNQSQTIELSGSALSESFFIASATETAIYNTTPSQSNILFTESNSNIDELLELQPEQLAIEYEIYLNPDNNQEEGFIYRGQGIETEMQVEIPLSLIAQNIILNDTVDFSVEVPEDLAEATFTLVAENGYPLSANIKLQFLDELGNVVDELSGNNTIQAGTLGENGEITSTTSTLSLPFNNNSGLLDNSKQLCLEATLNTAPSNQAVKIYSDYTIGLKLIGNFNYTVSN